MTQGTKMIRRLLSSDQDPPAEQVAASNVLPLFVRLVECVEHPVLQFEAAWALTNVASTALTHAVVEAGALPALVRMMRSPHADVREQCMWCLGNIVGDGPQMRDVVLAEPSAMEALLLNLQNPASPSLLRNATWTLSNFCRGKPQPALAVLLPCLPTLASLVRNADAEVVADACWALSYLSDGDDERIQAVVSSGVVPAVVALLKHADHAVVTPALRTVGNVVSGSDMHTQAVIEAGALAGLLPLLRHPRRNVRKETCWALSNIAAGTRAQIGKLVHCPGAVKALLEVMQHSEWEVRKEATWAVSNACTGGSTEHVHVVVAAGAIAPLCEMLSVADDKMQLVAMEALEAILKAGQEGDYDYAVAVDEAGGLDRIEDLQSHANGDIYRKAVRIIEEYFGTEDDGDENATPNVDEAAQAFKFSSSLAVPAGGFTFGGAQ